MSTNPQVLASLQVLAMTRVATGTYKYTHKYQTIHHSFRIIQLPQHLQHPVHSLASYLYA